MKTPKLTAKERSEPLFTTIGRIRGIAKTTDNTRLLLLIDKVTQNLQTTYYEK